MMMNAHAFEDLPEGFEEHWDYAVSPAVYEAFLRASGDESPIHVDDEAARARGFPGRVMHGGLLHAFLSHFVGMRLPGARALLLSADLRYVAPCHLGDQVRLVGRVAQRVESQRVLVLHVRFDNLTQGRAVARGRVQVQVAP